MPNPQNLVPSLANLLDHSSSTKNLQKLKQLHAKAIVFGVSSHDFLRAKLVAAYASCSQIREATHIFSRSNRQPTFLYNTLIRAYTSLNRFSSALSLFRDMLVARKPIDRHTLPTVLKSCAALSALRLGLQVHAAALGNGYFLDMANANALVSMYAKCGDLWSAKKVFDAMAKRNEVSYTSMMMGYGNCRESEEVFGLFERMLEEGVLPDEPAFTVVLTACSQCGLVEKGVEYFEMMEKRFSVRPSVEHYTCMVDLLGKAGRLEEAEKLIERMEVEPDKALRSALLGACKVHEKLEVTEKLAYGN